MRIIITQRENDYKLDIAPSNFKEALSELFVPFKMKRSDLNSGVTLEEARMYIKYFRKEFGIKEIVMIK